MKIHTRATRRARRVLSVVSIWLDDCAVPLALALALATPLLPDAAAA